MKRDVIRENTASSLHVRQEMGNDHKGRRFFYLIIRGLQMKKKEFQKKRKGIFPLHSGSPFITG
jgi:hypothetical protein